VSKSEATSPNRVVGTINAVMEIGFDGCSVSEIAKHAGITYHSARRALEALEASGWVEGLKQAGSNERLWRPGEKVLVIPFAYRRHCLSKIHTIENQYTKLTGERLNDEA
jgi:DNA-binding IclR family transcriptional regulator